MSNTNRNALQEYLAWYSAGNLKKRYPALNKILSRNRNRMRLFLSDTLEAITHNAEYTRGFVSARYLADKAHVSTEYANHLLNFFCTLGILNKAADDTDYKPENGLQPAITYDIVPCEDTYLQRIDERAAIMLQKKLTVSRISWEAVKNALGKEEADRIYREERESGYFPRLYADIFCEALSRLTAHDGYTTKAQLIEEARHVTGESPRGVEKRFAEFSPCLEELGYRYKRTSAADNASRAVYLPVGRWLIYRTT